MRKVSRDHVSRRMLALSRFTWALWTQLGNWFQPVHGGWCEGACCSPKPLLARTRGKVGGLGRGIIRSQCSRSS